MSAQSVAHPGRKERFVQEARAASALNHPNIITIYEIDAAEGVDFIAMEFVDGKTLDQLIGRKGLPLAEALRYAVQIADALASAHAAGIVHRDLKPANLMVTEKGLVKVLDFGLAKLTETIDSEDDGLTLTAAGAPRTEEGTVVGTASYMSPEQAEAKKVDTRSDIFSFGAVLYEMVTGRKAFAGESRVATLSAVLREEPKPVSEVAETTPAELERIIGRCLRKDPARRFQTMADLKVALEEVKEESASGEGARTAARSAPSRSRFGVVAAAVVGVIAAVLALWWVVRRPPAPVALEITRLTSETGVATTPAISADGKLLAYASDRAGDGNLEIYVQQIPGGQPLRLTNHPANDTDPAFSPDSRSIAFYSARDGGGLYVMPSLGGDARLLVAGGRRPRYSPDGAWIAYYTGEFQGGRSYILPAAGGPPLPVAPSLTSAAMPVWSPDGKRVLVAGMLDRRVDWWAAPRPDLGSAEPPVKTGAFPLFAAQNLLSQGPEIAPGDWRGSEVLFSTIAGPFQDMSLWRLAVSPSSGKATGKPQRLTAGAGHSYSPYTAADGSFVFTLMNANADLWSLPADTAEARPTGEVQRLTQDAAADVMPSVSADGTKLAFASNRSGSFDIWLKDLVSGKESALTATPGPEVFPVLSADGSRVAYLSPGLLGLSVYTIAAAGGAPQKACDSCGLPRSWTSDKTGLLLGSGRLLSLDTKEQVPVMKTSKLRPFDSSLSPDDRWVALLTYGQGSATSLFVAPLRREGVAEESEWIAVTDGSADDGVPRWSPDGNRLYFFSERDGSRCLWTLRLDPLTRRPLSPPAPFQHFHSTRRPAGLLEVGREVVVPSVARDKVVFLLGDITSNIWMARAPQ